MAVRVHSGHDLKTSGVQAVRFLPSDSQLGGIRHEDELELRPWALVSGGWDNSVGTLS